MGLSCTSSQDPQYGEIELKSEHRGRATAPKMGGNIHQDTHRSTGHNTPGFQYGEEFHSNKGAKGDVTHAGGWDQLPIIQRAHRTHTHWGRATPENPHHMKFRGIEKHRRDKAVYLDF